MFVLWLRLVPVACALLLGCALAVSLVRLFWHGGSYLKRKRQLLD